jgi:hypothetical protein
MDEPHQRIIFAVNTATSTSIRILLRDHWASCAVGTGDTLHIVFDDHVIQVIWFQ